MLTRLPATAAPIARQRGVVLLISLIVLVALTLAAIALVRSVDTANLIAGNLAFQQAATRSGDIGIERAIAVLQQKKTDGTLDSNDTTNGYFATLKATDTPASNQNWDVFWVASLSANAVNIAKDQFGNQVSFVIHRQCANAQPPSGGGQCVGSPLVGVATGNQEEAGEVQLKGSSQVYFRITVRVAGPRNTVSYVQAFVSM